jgi:hypothetical protein
MAKQDKLISFTVPTELEFSMIDGRNGCFPIQKLYLWESHDHRHVYIDGIGKRGVSIRGGLRVTMDCFYEAARRFIHEYSRLDRAQPAPDDCAIDAEGFCTTHNKVHLRESAQAMEVPAGEQTVLAEWGMRCPQCNSDDSIDIQMHVFGRLLPDGTDVSEPDDGSHDWDKDSLAVCAECQFAGTVSDFEVDEKGAGHGS